MEEKNTKPQPFSEDLHKSYYDLNKLTIKPKDLKPEDFKEEDGQ